MIADRNAVNKMAVRASVMYFFSLNVNFVYFLVDISGIINYTHHAE